jgi:flavodoxin
MKKIIYAITAFCFALLGTTQANAQGETSMKDKKVLVVYYSKSNNTKQIAQYIADTTYGDAFQIEPITPYPDDYRATTEQAKKEINEGYLPPIKSGIPNIKDYNIIFVGSPCWWATIAPPVSTFLTKHDLSGKIVIPFSTHEGSGLANNAKDTAKLTPNSTVLEGKAFRGSRVHSAKQDVINWINELKL